MKPCPHCQKPIPEKATFCVGCGRPLTPAGAPAGPSPPGAKPPAPPGPKPPSPGAKLPPPPGGHPTTPAPAPPAGQPSQAAGAARSPAHPPPGQPSGRTPATGAGGAGTTTKPKTPQRPPPPGPVVGPVTKPQTQPPQPAALQPQPEVGRRRRWPLAVGTAVVMLLAAGLGAWYYGQGWWLVHRPAAVSEAASASKPAPTSKPASAATQPSGDVAGAREKTPKPDVKEPAVPENLYSARTRVNREQWLLRYGGSARTETAVGNGLQWLARHQAKDGHWGADCLGTGPAACCRGPGSCTNAGGAFSVAHTGLATLAFQAGGHYYFNTNAHSDVVRRGLDWLVAQQAESGAIYARQVGENHHDYMYEHGIAALALCDACAVAAAAGQAADRRYAEAAERAVRFIESQQHRDGGWRYTSRPEASSDTSVSGWQVLALKSAKEAGIAPSPACLEQAVRFFRSCRWLDTGKSRYYVFAPEPTPAVSGMGMLVPALLLDQPDSEWVRQGAEYLADFAESQWGIPEPGKETRHYLWHSCTLAMFQHGGEPWKRWNDVVQERLLSTQDQDSQSCTFGSWDWQTDDYGQQGGRIYTTTLGVLTLEVYYRYGSQRARVYEDGAPQTAQASP